MKCTGMVANATESTCPPRKKSKKHKDKHTSNQYKALSAMMRKLFDMFDEYCLERDDALAFLQVAQQELGHEPEEATNFRNVVQEQYSSLTQKEKRTLIPLLTHTNNGATVNESVLQCLPFLEDRSRYLLANPERKVRDDKIDLKFISDFMHDHCRYIFICNAICNNEVTYY